MNNARDPRDRLLAAAFEDDVATTTPAMYARAAAASARRRHRLRRTTFAAAATIAIALTALVSSRPRSDAEITPTGHATTRRVAKVDTRAADAMPAATAVTNEASPRGYEIISDEQLLAHLPDQSLMLVKNADGTSELVALGSD